MPVAANVFGGVLERQESENPLCRPRVHRNASTLPMPRPGHLDLDTAERPLVLIWELTQACALACDHCRADARPQRRPDELSTPEGKRLLEAAGEFGDGQLVVLSGGDPLVREDVAELIAYGTDLGLRMTITPSGTRSLTRARIDELGDAGLRRMAVSLDGATADAHDAFRGEEGSFEETVRAVEDARAAGIPIQVNTTVCRATVDELRVAPTTAYTHNEHHPGGDRSRSARRLSGGPGVDRHRDRRRHPFVGTGCERAGYRRVHGRKRPSERGRE